MIRSLFLLFHKVICKICGLLVMEFRTLRNFAIRSNPKYTVPLDNKKIHYVKEGFYTTIG